MTGRDPYCIFHDLDEHFVPLGGGEPMPPPYPSRRRAVLAAFGRYQFENDAKLAGAKVSERPARKPKQPREQ